MTMSLDLQTSFNGRYITGTLCVKNEQGWIKAREDVVRSRIFLYFCYDLLI